MSLDVYLTIGGETKQQCEHCGGTGEMTIGPSQCYESNITHNLNRMAKEAGIYKHLWRPDEIGITKAGQLIEPLKAGLQLMLCDKERFKKFDASNGWGTYEQFLPWIREYLEACEKYPDAGVSVSR